jgi:two-component system OmpR family response regulator
MPADSASPLPKTLALIDDDAEYSEYLAQHLETLGIDVHHFADSNDLLTSTFPFDFGFYIVDLMLPGIDGVDLIGLLRRRTQAGIVVVSGRTAPDVFANVIDAGADMYLTKPVSFEQVVVAIRGVHRRVATPASQAWVLDLRASRLVAPDGVAIGLSDADFAVMQSFLEAGGETVTRDALCRRLGHPASAEAENLLSATIYRLRRRIERATPLPVPLQTQARVGYVFRGELRSA